MKFRIAGLICLASLLGAAPAAAQGTAVALRLGTMGPSMGAVVAVHPRVNLRVDVPYLPYSRVDDVTISDRDLTVDSDIELLTVAGLAEFYPFGNALRLMAGAALNRSEGTLVIRAAGPYEVGGTTYSPEEVGELTGVLKHGKEIAPYLGLGLGNAVGEGKRLGFSLEAGAMLSGSPAVTLSGTGMIAPTADQADRINENLEWVEFYPVLTLGLTYKIF